MSRRADLVAAFAAKRAAGRAIIGAGAGTGISAKFLHRGGADLLFIYNSGRFRMQGLSSWVGHLPFGDANQIVLDMGEREILPMVPDAAVIAGVCGIDPTRRMSHYLPQIVAAGFAGIINYPTVAVIDGRMRADLEAGGLGFDKEIELIRLAAALDLLTTAYVTTPDEAAAMVAAGVDIVVAHMGLTAGGSIGAAHAVSFEDAAAGVSAITDRSRAARADVFVLAHGGPIASSADAERLFSLVDVDGFVGASSMERLPIEEPLRANTAAFAALSTRRGAR
ncbi:MAG TPA: phosphoenolpyruvate hydrolase family protein [Kaistia sp.]|nr:phosphoenolpyruvate hydrolase family protein [Kaistia sp.]